MAKKNELPATLFVVRRKEDSTEFFIADVGHDDFNDGEVVGKYKLVSTGVKRIEHRLEDK